MSRSERVIPIADADLAEVIGNGARRLTVDLSAAQLAALVSYLRLLERWNSTYNLTSIRDPVAMATHHILDCLAVVPPLRRHDGRAPVRLLDVGSGAGLPGVVLAVAEPAVDVVCIDSVGKKAAFTAQVASALALKNLRSTQGRVESLRDRAGFAVVTSRAFSSLSDFVAATRHLLQQDGSWLAMKGKVPTDELNAAPDDVTFHVEQLIVPGVDADRCIVWGSLKKAVEVGASLHEKREPA